MKTIKQYGLEIQNLLPDFYDFNEKKSISEFFIKEILNLSNTEYLLKKNDLLSKQELLKLENKKDRLLAGEPVQYVLNKAYFYGYEFFVDKRVLIPRQETEILIDEIIKLYKSEENLEILDIGCGSGNIAISLKKNLKDSQVSVIDISAGALDVCSKNATNHNVNLCFYQYDILSTEDKFFNEISFDLIVSNPPYVRNSEKDLILKNVTEFEPANAIFVSDNEPLIYYQAIAGFAKTHLKPKGALFFEINEAFGPHIVQICHNSGFTQVKIIQDLHNKDRFVFARGLG
ncbi:MAG: peptide chain release factor N(5)-glutamine methyltransferase [Bacteroidales bacterium]|nr:peptide chain release factor N(5)-glutamine methyltransferase [Bacteroidales bacterium]MCK9499314.1 peptide chain release factor N(5)-glutamine methyltransferase [Bacteroidales bacterium]MDY0313825.1 peptide chain release factor N(5)-glutamine methyltransferase [Bacteroidales bacterium]NLB87363.1 peptide chain release factor N(5)-glutamine methyltransferase [Bacteroidales bacterium]